MRFERVGHGPDMSHDRRCQNGLLAAWESSSPTLPDEFLGDEEMTEEIRRVRKIRKCPFSVISGKCSKCNAVVLHGFRLKQHLKQIKKVKEAWGLKVDTKSQKYAAHNCSRMCKTQRDPSQRNPPRKLCKNSEVLFETDSSQNFVW